MGLDRAAKSARKAKRMNYRIVLQDECPRSAQPLWSYNGQDSIEWAKEQFETDNVNFYNNHVTEKDGEYFRLFTLEVDRQTKYVRMDIDGSFSEIGE